MTAYHKGEMVAEETYHLGRKMEVCDAEQYAIRKATEIAKKFTDRHREIRQVWIFSDNQKAIGCIRTTKEGPGHYMVLSSRGCIFALQGFNVKVTIQGVPGQVEMPEKNNANWLAKEGTRGTRQESDARTSITYLKRHIPRNLENMGREVENREKGKELPQHTVKKDQLPDYYYH